jgi:CheY-like chemotaxis protein
MTTILFVEDQFELRAIHVAYLESHGYHVVTADDGDAGLEAARRVRPDIIVLDHSLPRRTGVDVARAIQSDPEMRGVPIIMMTAHTYGAVGRKARAAGCVGFLAKPCTPSRLLYEVNRLSRTSASA